MKAWVEQKENINVIETTLQITRMQSGEMTTGRELLTIGEMKLKGFSQSLGDLQLYFLFFRVLQR